MALVYETRFSKVGNSLYVLIPAVIWQDSVFQKVFGGKSIDEVKLEVVLELSKSRIIVKLPVVGKA